MSNIIKILLEIKTEIAGQRDFVQGKDTTNSIYILWTTTLEIQKEVYLCFIDCTKAFDRVRLDKIITQLTQLKIDGKDMQAIKIM